VAFLTSAHSNERVPVNDELSEGRPASTGQQTFRREELLRERKGELHEHEQSHCIALYTGKRRIKT